MGKTAIRASVHAVVEYALMGGDLALSASAERLMEGVRGHRSLQSVPQEGVRNEVPVRLTMEGDRVSLTVYGRIDRLHRLEMVEEIKTTLGPAPEEGWPLHWAQAECYAHMLCSQEDLPHIDVRLTYLNLEDGELTRLTRTLARDVLAERFTGYVRRYLDYLERLDAHRTLLKQEMQSLSFPFAKYRAGQRELAGEVYRAIRDKRMLLAQAPTGTGKTLAALFPALKGIGEGYVERIFYLTARTTTGQAAFSALKQLPSSSLRALSLHAREKCCVHEAPICRTGLCPRQLGYYDRLPDALSCAWEQSGLLGREAVRRLADRFELCPFELSLDLSLECDVIVCDYNYLFDPRVRLQRYASGGRQGQVLLIDEAHNLPDRARNMYSCALSVRTLNELRKRIPKDRRKEGLYCSLRALIRAIEAAAQEDELPRAERALRQDILTLCEQTLCQLKSSDALPPQEASALFLDLSSFIFLASSYDENHYMLFDGGKTTRQLTLFCADASQKIGAVLRRSRAAILFSATLTPMEFYRTLCGVAEESPCVYLLSPFPPQNLLTLHLSVNTRYKAREKTMPRIVSAIASFVRARSTGNFIAFFPSYTYLNQAKDGILEELGDDAVLLVQQPAMDDEEREGFLHRFKPDPSGRLLGLCVLGGAFSEGIDLPAERLCGAVVVGVGLPQVGIERDTLRARFDEKYGDGFSYAYVYPGIGKVLQAAGRIIRTENDRGALLLIDDRYSTETYRALLPTQWTMQRVWNDVETSSICAHFWQS